MIRPVSLILSIVCPLIAQNQVEPATFEVADVKLTQSAGVRMSVDFQPGAKFSARNVPLKILIALAYHVRPDAVVGPGWRDSSRYDITAKGSQSATPDQVRRMVQTLLAERFHLSAHKEERSMPAFALEVSTQGPKLQASENAALSEQRCIPGEALAGQKHFVCRLLTMALLTDTLQEIASRDLDFPVVDRTDLHGSFDFQLHWTPSAPAATPSADDAISGQTL